MKTIGERLGEVAELLFNGNRSNLANKLEMSPQSLNKYFKDDRTPGGDILTRLSNIGVNVNWLLTGEGQPIKIGDVEIPVKRGAYKEKLDGIHHGLTMFKESTVPYGITKAKRIPILGKIFAGYPEIQEQNILGYLHDEEAPDDVFALLIDGDSMSADDILHGDYVYVRQNAEIKEMDIVAAMNEFNEVMIKKYVNRNGEFWLESSNPVYPNFKVNGEYKLIGKVIQRNRNRIKRFN